MGAPQHGVPAGLEVGHEPLSRGSQTCTTQPKGLVGQGTAGLAEYGDAVQGNRKGPRGRGKVLVWFC